MRSEPKAKPREPRLEGRSSPGHVDGGVDAVHAEGVVGGAPRVMCLAWWAAPASWAGRECWGSPVKSSRPCPPCSPVLRVWRAPRTQRPRHSQGPPGHVEGSGRLLVLYVGMLVMRPEGDNDAAAPTLRLYSLDVGRGLPLHGAGAVDHCTKAETEPKREGARPADKQVPAISANPLSP